MKGMRGFCLVLVALLTAACAAAQPATISVPLTPVPSAATAPSAATTAEPIPTVTPAPATPSSAVATPTSAPIATVAPQAATTPSPIAAPKAVFIVGPTDDQTDSNLASAEAMAEQAESAGMDVRRVFFPHATWDNVLAEVQGASLVAYFGHGYGWPSNTDKLTESSQDGMGLNSYDGSGPAEVTYYGATLITQNFRLAPHAVVFLQHGCYTAGNGELGAPIPTSDVARQRVDNFASGWLEAGAGAVFALQWGTRFDYPDALTNTDSTIDQLFTSPREYVGSNELYFDSQRTPGAVNHLDPDPKDGYLRAVTGDLAMTTATWRSGAGQTLPAADVGT